MIVPQACSIVEAAAAIYQRHTASHFVGLLLHGSALKGGFVPNCSDIDFQLYVDSTLITPSHSLPLEMALAIKRDLHTIDPAPFRYVQCMVLGSHIPAGWVGPIPGAYAVIAGRLPVAEATAEELVQSARASLQSLNSEPRDVINKLIQHGGGRLQRGIRLLVTKVSPVMVQVATVCNPAAVLDIWNLNKRQVIELLPAPIMTRAQVYFAALDHYYPDETSFADGLATIEQGIGFLRTVKAWWADHDS